MCNETEISLPEGFTEFLNGGSANNYKRKFKCKILIFYLESRRSFNCHFCQKEMTLRGPIKGKPTPSNFLTIEHLKPISSFRKELESGYTKNKLRKQHSSPANDVNNIALSCFACNMKKSETERPNLRTTWRESVEIERRSKIKKVS